MYAEEGMTLRPEPPLSRPTVMRVSPRPCRGMACRLSRMEAAAKSELLPAWGSEPECEARPVSSTSNFVVARKPVVPQTSS